MENIARIANTIPDCHCHCHCHWDLKLALSGSCLCLEIFYPESFTVLKKNIFREAWNNLLKPLSKSKLGFHELALPKLSISVKRNFAHFSVPYFSQKIVADFIIFAKGKVDPGSECTKHPLHLLQAQKSRQQLWQLLHAVNSRALNLFFFLASSSKSIFIQQLSRSVCSLPTSYYVTCPRSPQPVQIICVCSEIWAFSFLLLYAKSVVCSACVIPIGF